MPEGRPYNLGNTSADMASLNATSEMSASSRSRGRALQNARQVSYDEDGRYASDSAPSSAGYTSDGAAEARSILSGRGLY
jgi:rare lipoprotein A